nr:MAG TPA: hypothetical protein [Siphoviridae sp. ctzrC10]
MSNTIFHLLKCDISCFCIKYNTIFRTCQRIFKNIFTKFRILVLIFRKRRVTISNSKG